MMYCADCGREITGTRFVRHEKLRFHPRCVPDGILAVDPPVTITSYGDTVVRLRLPNRDEKPGGED